MTEIRTRRILHTKKQSFPGHKILWGWIAVCTFLAILSHTDPGFCLDDINDLREHAIQIAREGQLDKSIELLEDYYHQEPDNLALISDLIVIYTWNGDHSKATQLFSQYPATDFPEYVLVSLLASYRQHGKGEDGLLFLESLPPESINKPAIQIKKGQMLVDTGRFVEADAVLQTVRKQNGVHPELLTPFAYLYSASEQWIEALASYTQILELEPGNEEAIQGKISALLQLGAPFAASLTQPPPTEENIAQQIAILQGKAALYLRWSTYASKDSEESLGYGRESYRLLNNALQLIEKSSDRTDIKNSILYDLVVAHTSIQQYDEAYTLYNKLTEEGQVPVYVQRAAAEALLALKQPEEAVKILSAIPEETRRDYQTDLTSFFAFIENEQFRDAYDLIDKRLRNTPQFRKFSDTSQQYRNDERLDLEMVAIQGRLYGDQLSEAWERIRTLRDRAPANDWLNHLAGEVALARDWPHAAHTLYQTAYRLNPNNHDGLAGMAQSDIRLNRLKSAQRKLSALQETSPKERATKELEKSIATANSLNLWADLELSYSEGPEQSGDGLKATTELISSPINHHLYLSLQGQYAWSEIIEGEESRTTYGGGLEYRGENLSFLSLLQYNESTVDKAGGIVRTNWAPDDNWLVSLQGEIFSDATPLRALYYGIREDRVVASTSYRWHEGRSLFFSLAGGWFTDDNNRIEASAAFTERIIDIPRFDLDITLDLYGSKNSRDDAPYYNPASDLSTKGIVSAEHIIYRLYETSLTQKIYGTLGLYAQENYSTGPVANIGYNLRYNYYPRIETVCGVEIGENRYDGEEEPYYKFTFLIHARF